MLEKEKELLLNFCKWAGENTPTQSVLKPEQLVEGYFKYIKRINKNDR